jgi:hypothetical protein
MPFFNPLALSISLERLLPSHHAIPAPFITQDKCQELMMLIRSFGGTYQTYHLFLQQIILIYETTDDHDDHEIQTRIVSSVLLGVGQSTFTYFLLHIPTWLTLLINAQPTGVESTSDPTNVFLLT